MLDEYSTVQYRVQCTEYSVLHALADNRLKRSVYQHQFFRQKQTRHTNHVSTARQGPIYKLEFGGQIRGLGEGSPPEAGAVLSLQPEI